MGRRIALVVALLLTMALTACGNGDDASGPTETEAEDPPVTATTAIPRPSPTPPPASPTNSTFTDEEAALLDLLLSAGDLSGDWTQLRVEAPELSQVPGICDAPAFPSASERIAEVEVEYQSNDSARFVVQDITRFPDDVAVDAMAHIRDASTCTEWTNSTGIVYRISPTEAPAIGDEAHAINIAFQVADAGELRGTFTFFRIDGYVTVVSTLALNEDDPAFTTDVATLAAGKIESLLGTGANVTDHEAELIGQLLTLDDFRADWDQLRPARRAEPDSWTGLCDSALFPQTDDALARVGVEFYEGFEATSATLTQLLTAYPGDMASAAFEYEREAASCPTFDANGTTVTLEPADDFPALGDESFAVRFTFASGESAAAGYWIVIRSAERLTTLVYTDPSDLTMNDAITYATTAAERIAATP